jgi:uncharacterized protein (TIGR00369 family)
LSTNDTQQQIRQITEQLNDLDASQLQEVLHTIGALKSSAAGGLHYFGQWLGIEWDPDGRPFMRLAEHNANMHGVAQGGALYTLADISIGFMIYKDLPPGGQVYTQEMKVNYTKKGLGDKVYATPQVLHRGRYTVVAECRIHDEEGDLVAVALGTFFVPDMK